MPTSPQPISRRDFLRLAGSGLAGLLLPVELPGAESLLKLHWPTFRLQDLPDRLGELISQLPDIRVNAAGYAELFSTAGERLGNLPVAPTKWNLENMKRWHRLESGKPWGIVLHWFGDRPTFPGTVQAFINGFDGIKEYGEKGEIKTRSSAHFLVGKRAVYAGQARPNHLVGILQTQLPDADGTPFVAAHVSTVDQNAFRSGRQYFVKALYQLGYEEPGIHSLLQDFYSGSRIYPNVRTIGIEISGTKFEELAYAPTDQEVINVAALVWALMERYEVPAMNLMGHHELELGKPDPGKKFMALIRMLIGAKALVSPDERMKRLVFGNFLDAGLDTDQAVVRYFKFVHDYMVMTGSPRRVYEWEADSKFWFLFERLRGRDPGMGLATHYEPPLLGQTSGKGNYYLKPTNHEGVDLYPTHWSQRRSNPYSVHLPANGVCLHVGDSECCRRGKIALFRHRQPDGAEVVSVFGHLTDLGEISPGRRYPAGYRLGAFGASEEHLESFLHFAVAYAGTWRTYLSQNTKLPINIGPTWINDRYLHPITYLQERIKDRIPLNLRED